MLVATLAVASRSSAEPVEPAEPVKAMLTEPDAAGRQAATQATAYEAAAGQRIAEQEAYIAAVVEAERQEAERQAVLAAQRLEAQRKASAAAAAQRAPAPRTATAAPRTEAVGDCGGWDELIAAHFPGEVVKACSVMMCESRGNPQAENSSSSASGLFQFLSSTWESTTGTPAPASAYSGGTQIAAAAKLWRSSGWSPWVCG